MNTISLIQPQKLKFGTTAFKEFLEDLSHTTHKRIWVLGIEPLSENLEMIREKVQEKNKAISIHTFMQGEPTFSHYQNFFKDVHVFLPDLVVGFGGGSVLDLAKVLAAMVGSPQKLEEVIGINKLAERKVGLWCLPTTSGTGSEVSPNAILLDEDTLEKKGIISPFLVPDATYVDPSLTMSLPAGLTAETGIDALSHCMEAYTNKYSHPLIDDYALRGMTHIGNHLLRAYEDGKDIAARSALSLGSLYGGFCLGPVNTAGVHALSYPLGGKYHVPHGLANAVLLPEVMAFNLPSSMDKYAKVALAMGVEEGDSVSETARRGVEKTRELLQACGIPESLKDLGVAENEIPELANLAMKVTRLLKNNPRELGYNEAVEIYSRLI
ncbi:iron-containing alcohol dehydrogenase [Pleomorphovibrio marinus]|uniref:iron-containing alcohol dehydrogenase n=1 Tax=Pleomorphovibrio marinus TaxID=2164132 RepID=UPI000E0AB022|nr:iron-containing alcohol dehydrogenase [Pleomorphovibrio marinus]